MAITEGIDIFIHSIPNQVTESHLRNYLSPHLRLYGIHDHELHKPKNRGFANLYVPNRLNGDRFLSAMSKQTMLRLNPRYPLKFTINKKQDGGAMARDNKFKEETIAEIEASITQSMRGKGSYISYYH